MTACLLLAASSVFAQGTYYPGWSGYIGDDWDMDGVYAVASDSQTHYFFGGFLGQGSIRNASGIYSETAYQGARDGFVAKLSDTGSLVGYLCLGREENDCIMGVAAHTNGMVYAAGVSERTEIDDTGSDALIASIDGTSGSVNWMNTLGNANGTNGFNAVAVDASGYVYAVGYTTYTNLAHTVPGYQVGGTTYGRELKGNTDAFVVKLSPGGAIVWTHYLGGTNADAATACAVSPDGSVYVGGETRSPGWASLPSGTPGPNNQEGFLVKLTSNGTHVWSAFFGGSAADSVTALVKEPGSSALYFGGSTASSGFLSSANRLNTQAGGTDGFAVKLTESGATFQTNWCRFFGGSTSDRVTALALRAGGGVSVGGTTASGSWLTQAGTSVFGGVQDGFLSQLDSDGAVSWSAYVGGARSDELRALASAPNTLLTAGSTYSPNWVSGGFWDTWSKDTNFDFEPDLDADLTFGFVATWSSEPGVPPAISGEPEDLTVNEAAPATFSVTATGSSPLSYRWFRNGVPVSGPDSNRYTVAAAAVTNDNDTYSCLVSNLFGTATSRAAKLTVIADGTLSVTLAPAEAVAQGARWSCNGGTTWLASGSGTNLPPGTYTVAFTNLTGWNAPAALAGLQLAAGAIVATSGVYTAVLPSADRAITGTNVTVTVRAPAGLSTWELVETLAAGLTPANITAGGVWNSGARTLTFTGIEATTNALSYTVLCVTSGVYTVSGTVTPHPANQPVAVTGPSQIVKANLIRTISGSAVTITMNHSATPSVWYVYESVPEGLTPVNITGPGSWNSGTRKITWFAFDAGQTLTYSVEGDPGSYTVSGVGNVSGSEEPVFGDTVVLIQGAEIPPPDILSLVPAPGVSACTLVFTSVVDQAYVILTNAVLQGTNGWAACLPVTGEAGTTQRQVPMDGPRLFYRVRVLP